jgi:hypothetical protein
MTYSRPMILALASITAGVQSGLKDGTEFVDQTDHGVPAGSSSCAYEVDE